MGPTCRNSRTRAKWDADKIEFGQFYTTTNPFRSQVFAEWLYKSGDGTILEPFAGANNIVEMIREIGCTREWVCFDISPPSQELNTSGIKVSRRDTIRDFPSGFSTAITNPPYLAKSSATRRGIPWGENPYDNLYKLALDKMLHGCDYVAAIIPASFITSGLFRDRLWAVDILAKTMFADTEEQVCLAMFVPSQCDDFVIYENHIRVGTFSEIRVFDLPPADDSIPIQFNDPNGTVGLCAVDGRSMPSIRFINGENIPPETVSHSSRRVTRISIPNDVDLNTVISNANKILMDYRIQTRDILMTTFKGLRKDGRYRRRLNYATARKILSRAILDARLPDRLEID